ncbi:MAG: sulfatase [Vulcanimicrobiota bacterium]
MTTKRLINIVTAVLMAAALMFILSSCRPHVGSSLDSKTPINVLLITVSGLCFDHLGCYGSSVARTPTIDKLASKGAMFTEAYTTSDMTTPAAISLMTSLSVKHHSPYRYVGTQSKDSTTLPAILQGYDTCGVGGTFLLDPEAFPPAATFGSYYSPGLRRKSFRATDVNLFAANFFEEHKTRPWFLWVNYSNICEPSQASEDAVPTLESYDRSVSSVDSAISTLLAALDELRLSNRTLIIITAEHGRNIEEKGLYSEHTGLYEEILHIPLIMTLPGRISPKRISGLVSILDILPTVRDFLGIKSEPYIEGMSLVPVIDGTAQKIDRILFAESFLQTAAAVRNGEYKFIRYHDVSTGKEQQDATPSEGTSRDNELYNIAKDPGETMNLAFSFDNAEQLKEMEAALERWYSDSPYKEKDKRPQVSLPLMTRLRTLGIK